MAWRMPDTLKSILDESELEWEIDHKKKHRLVRIEGEVVMALPQSHFKGGRHALNNIATLKRAIKSIKEDRQ